MKKSNWIALMLCFLLLTGCAKSFDEMTVEERIEAATDLDGIMACVEDLRNSYSTRYTDENAAALFEKVETHLFTEGTFNGTYYYTVQHFPGTVEYNKYGSSDSYRIVVYSVSPDEIYLVPKADAPANIQDIPSMSNASSYRYQTAKNDYPYSRLKQRDPGRDEYYVPFDLQRYQDNNFELRYGFL